MQKLTFGLAAVSCALLAGTSASAAIVFTGTGSGFGSGNAKAASVSFDIVAGNKLQIVLTNTSAADVEVPADVLAAVLFNVSGNALSLTRESVVLNTGSSVVYGSTPADGIVGGEFAYKAGLSGAPGNRQYGISSSGLSPLFGPPDLFPGPNLAGPASPDGIQFGLTSAGDNIATGNGGITGSDGLIKNSVVITLGGLPANFELARIRGVLFVYGTSIGEGQFEGQVPTPGALAILGLGGLAASRRRRTA